MLRYGGPGPSPVFVTSSATQFLGSNGSAAVPTFAFSATPATGFYSSATNLIDVSINGFDAYRFSNLSFGLTTNGAFDLGSAGIGWKRIYADFTNTTTVGAVTINKVSGRVNAGTATTTLRVTCSLVMVNAHVMALCSTNDSTARITAVVPSAGFFDIFYAAPAGQCSIDYFIINAD